MSRPSNEVTDLLDAWSSGDPKALDELMPVVYDELYKIASRQFQRESGGHTLQPTAVVNEAYLRFKDQRKVTWRDRTEFFAVAAKLIRRVLVDHARRRKRKKRGGELSKMPIDERFDIAEVREADLIALDDALRGLTQLAPRQSRIVEMRVFAGLSLEDVAEVLKIGRSTVHRDWSVALLWLRRELSSD